MAHRTIPVDDGELEFRKQKYTSKSAVEDVRIKCTACTKDITHVVLIKSKLYEHVSLGVIVCKSCYKFYGNGDFTVGTDGLDEFCRWCGEGGQLYVCSKCPAAFCKKCIKFNCNRSYLNDIEKEDWLCFFCAPKPLYSCRALCWAVQEFLLKEKKSEKPGDTSRESLKLDSESRQRLENLIHKMKNRLDQSVDDFKRSLDEKVKGIEQMEDEDILETVKTISTTISTATEALTKHKKSISYFLRRLSISNKKSGKIKVLTEIDITLSDDEIEKVLEEGDVSEGDVVEKTLPTPLDESPDQNSSMKESLVEKETEKTVEKETSLPVLKLKKIEDLLDPIHLKKSAPASTTEVSPASANSTKSVDKRVNVGGLALSPLSLSNKTKKSPTPAQATPKRTSRTSSRSSVDSVFGSSSSPSPSPVTSKSAIVTKRQCGDAKGRKSEGVKDTLLSGTESTASDESISFLLRKPPKKKRKSFSPTTQVKGTETEKTENIPLSDSDDAFSKILRTSNCERSEYPSVKTTSKKRKEEDLEDFLDASSSECETETDIGNSIRNSFQHILSETKMDENFIAAAALAANLSNSEDDSLDMFINGKTSTQEKTPSTKAAKKGTPARKGYTDSVLRKKIDSSEDEEEKLDDKSKAPILLSSDESVIIKSDPPKVKKKKKKKILFSSDSDNADSPSDESSSRSSTPKLVEPVTKKRRRIATHSDSSGTDEGNTPKSKKDGRKNIRKVKKEEVLTESTKSALKEEEERKKRIAEKQKLFNEMISVAVEKHKELEEVVLDFDPKTKKTLLSVHPALVKKLKPHQAEGVKFMWDACFESLEKLKKDKGSGCILAHCMGLGKTLQVVTLLHTLLTNEETGVTTALVVCPLSTVMNWSNEFDKWLEFVTDGPSVEIYNMAKVKVAHRTYQLQSWRDNGGVMIMSYNLCRALIGDTKKGASKKKQVHKTALVDPGPDIVICDEGHLLKNQSTALSSSMSKIKTPRRIVLTGTPLQNNLIEYHCMVQFVKPSLLGTLKEFRNRFVNPIQNGQFEDSTPHDVRLMKRRAHVLHSMLDGIVQRRDYNILAPFLPPKYEYVIHLKLSEAQCALYRKYLATINEEVERRKLFIHFQNLSRICSHPRAVLMKSERDLLREEELEDESEGSLKDFIDDSTSDESSFKSSTSESDSDSNSGSSGPKKSKKPRKNTRSKKKEKDGKEEEKENSVSRSPPPEPKKWYEGLIEEEVTESISSSSKLFMFFSILKLCDEIGDKLLVFSQSLFTLDIIEYFLSKISNGDASDDPNCSGFTGRWQKNIDYFRLDGGVGSENRNIDTLRFNKNTRPRLFLISTKAGGLGINLIGANRVILYDASWNPSSDVQSIFRVYRFGQVKPVYIYRFLSKGTMEEKIYERQVAKLSMALRVVDEHQIERHFSHSTLSELYVFDPEGSALQATPALPKDRVMAELLQTHKDTILSYHQHDSLLVNIEEQELSEEERKAAWTEFEDEKKRGTSVFFNSNTSTNVNPSFMTLFQALKTAMPHLTDHEVYQQAWITIYKNPQAYGNLGFQPINKQAPSIMYAQQQLNGVNLPNSQGILRPMYQPNNQIQQRYPTAPNLMTMSHFNQMLPSGPPYNQGGSTIMIQNPKSSRQPQPGTSSMGRPPSKKNDPGEVIVIDS